jgi:Diacylglycerol kinase catalytic domain
MKVYALINPAAGSVGLDGSRRMKRALASAGIEQAEVIAFDPTSANKQISEFINKRPDLLVIWGGDGTHRTALRAAGLGFDRLLLLPGGTMNLLSKWVHGPRQWDGILQSVLANCSSRGLPAGMANDEPFFCALLAGVPATLAQAREDLRLGDIGKAIQDVGVAVESVRQLHIGARVRDAPGAIDSLPEGNVIAALVGPMTRGSRMEVAGLNLPSAMATLGFAWSSMRSDWHYLDGVRCREADTLEIFDDSGHSIPVIVDGEKIDLGSRFVVRFQDVAAHCLIAR